MTEESIIDRILDREEEMIEEQQIKADRQHGDLEQKLVALKPMFEALAPIRELGFDILYNLDKGHLPCPAIQTSIMRAHQIWLHNGKWSVDGGIGRHKKGLTLDQVVELVEVATAKHLTVGWRQPKIRYGKIIEGDYIIGRDPKA